MAKKVTGIKRIIDWGDEGYGRLQFVVDPPEYLGSFMGDPNSIVPPGSDLATTEDRVIETPLFNAAGIIDLTEELKRYEILYLELEAGNRLKNMSVEPVSDIDVDLIFAGEGNRVLLGFYQAGKSGRITVKAEKIKDQQFIRKLKNHNKDLHYRLYLLGKCKLDSEIPEQEFPEYMTYQQVAEYLQRSIQTVYNWKNEGKISPAKKEGTHPLFSKKEIDEKFFA